jgi:hypothetical protein
VTKYTPDSKPGRLLPLHEKVSRIVQSLAKSSSKAQPDLQESAMVEIPEKVVEQAIRTWRERSYYLPDETSERAKSLLSDGIKSCRKLVKDYQAALKPGRARIKTNPP